MGGRLSCNLAETAYFLKSVLFLSILIESPCCYYYNCLIFVQKLTSYNLIYQHENLAVKIAVLLSFSPSLKDCIYFFYSFPFIWKCKKSLDNKKNEKCHNVKYEMITFFNV